MPKLRNMLQILQMRKWFCVGVVVGRHNGNWQKRRQRRMMFKRQRSKVVMAKSAAKAAMAKGDFVPDLPK